jgi:hypothetical protein
MSPVRNAIAELVDRRLWPLAVVLAAAVVAIPVLLTKHPSSSAPASSVAATPAPAAGQPAVELQTSDGGPVVGKVRNPFNQQHVPKASTSTNPANALGPAHASTGSTAGTSNGSASSPSSGGSVSTPPVTHRTPTRSSTPGAVLEVRFGLANGARRKYDVSPGSPLPSATNPLLVYLGQAKGGQSSFLVSSDAQPQGDGRCEPDRSICSTLYLRAGDTEFFDVTGVGGTVQYELEVLKLRS